MHKFVFAALLVTGFSISGYSCDVCGAVNSSLGLGTVAAGNRHSFGISYQLRTYSSNHPPLFDEPSVQSREQFQRFDLKGTIRLSERWQLNAVIPVVRNTQQKTGAESSQSGIGDAQLTVHRFLIYRQDSLNTFNLRWSVGAGIKLPAGRFPEPHDEQLLLYPGTGTWDPAVQSSFYLRKNNWGLIQEINAVFRTSNKYGYTPGSVLSATLFGQRRFSNWSLFGGFQYGWNGTDYLDRAAVNSSPSRGNILSATLGATIQWGNILLQGNYHLPVVQNLGNGSVQQQIGFTASIFYIFNS